VSPTPHDPFAPHVADPAPPKKTTPRKRGAARKTSPADVNPKSGEQMVVDATASRKSSPRAAASKGRRGGKAAKRGARRG
jgi:hypothetical protein